MVYNKVKPSRLIAITNFLLVLQRDRRSSFSGEGYGKSDSFLKRFLCFKSTPDGEDGGLRCVYRATCA